MSNLSLQINLSPGDVTYAHLIVPKLVEAHRANVAEVFAIVDCCRAKKTPAFDPDVRLPEPGFSQRVERIRVIVEELKSAGYLDRVVYLFPGDRSFSSISKKYLARLVHETHECGGTALMSYFSAFEQAKTRYLLHYDADMLLYQERGYDWAVEAMGVMEKHSDAIAASPRVSPPFHHHLKLPDAPTLHASDDPAIEIEGGWQVKWFSTRCFLMDLDKLAKFLPLVKGRLFFEMIARKVLQRGYPPSPEMMLFRRICPAGGWRLDLKTEKAWLLHPADKSAKFLELLPHMQQLVAVGKVPPDQLGWENIKLEVWEQFLAESRY